jgi:hypothetical protein
MLSKHDPANRCTQRPGFPQKEILVKCCLVFSLFVATLGAAQAQTLVDEASKDSPVAYVYVARPTHIDTFAAASDGKLTAVGTPISGSISGMSVNKKYLFGFSAPGATRAINAYKIASDGAVALSTITQLPTDDNCPTGPLQIEYTGKTLYLLVEDCYNTGEQSVESFEIESEGALKYLGTSGLSGYESLSVPQPTILGNNKFAFNTGCYTDSSGDYPSPFFSTYTLKSDGLMVTNSASFAGPPAYSGDGTACPELLAGDTTDHVVMAGQDFNYNTGYFDGPVFLATYTADSHGNLTTKSTAKNMATVSSELYEVTALSIDPTSKLLAVGDLGFELFHWNGGEPATKYTGVLLKGHGIVQLCWDTAHHLYVLTEDGYVYVYTVTATSIHEAPGSPYLIAEASGLIVLSE